MDDSTYASIVVGVLDAGGRRVVAYGDAGRGAAPDASTVYEIGSITKVFTATLLAEMAERGEVRLDDPVAKYLPSGVKVPQRNGRQITLLDLATQSSGLPRMPSNFAPKDPENPYADYGPQQLYDFLSGYTLPRDVGAQYEYSNVGVGLLGQALALRAGTSYEAALAARVLDPLGLRDTRVTLTPAMRARLAPGHDPAGAVVKNWDLDALAGAGALRSTADDMLAWLAANLAAEDTTRSSAASTPAIPPTLLRAMRAAHQVRRPTGTPNISIALNWHTLERPDGRILWHNGGTGGYRSFIGVDPARRTAVVVLTNTSQSVDDVGFHLLVPSLPLTPPPRPPRHRAIALDSTVLQRYVGEYEVSPVIRFTVRRQGAHLTLQLGAQPPQEMIPESETSFFFTDVDTRVLFERDASGAVTTLVMRVGGHDTRARRVK